MKKTIQQGAVAEEEVAEVFVNGKNTVPMRNADQLEGHTGSAFHSVFVAAGRTEAAEAAKRDKFEFPAVRAAIHGAAERGITAVYHLFDVFHFTIAWMEGILDFFVMVFEDFLSVWSGQVFQKAVDIIEKKAYTDYVREVRKSMNI